MILPPAVTKVKADGIIGNKAPFVNTKTKQIPFRLIIAPVIFMPPFKGNKRDYKAIRLPTTDQIQIQKISTHKGENHNIVR